VLGACQWRPWSRNADNIYKINYIDKAHTQAPAPVTISHHHQLTIIEQQRQPQPQKQAPANTSFQLPRIGAGHFQLI